MAANNLEGMDTAELIADYKATGDLAFRNAAVEKNRRLAEGIAARFSGRGVEYDDLVQVAYVALIGAIERFDPGRGYKFSTFAAPTMIGEIKNYFRDKTRMLHISRRDSEQLLSYNEAVETLEKSGGARTGEIARRMGVSEERVLELMEMQRSGSVSSLEKLVSESEGENALKDLLGLQDKGFEKIENRDFVLNAVKRLSLLEQQIVELRFWKNKSQSDVAGELGVSQMFVSRAERKILDKLRGYMRE